ncbi:hypothetical protein MT391_20260 [Vibrio sp. 1-Bac 57]
MEILNNAWFVGIGGGVLSSLIVAIITRKIFSKRDNREYFQKVQSANREVLYAIRPGISEGVIPNKDIIEHLIEATARKYSVEIDSMLNLAEISSELIKEVMDSSFISAQTKQDFCEKLSSLKPEAKTNELTESIKKSYSRDKYRSQMVTMMATMAGLTTAVAAFYTSFKSDLIESPERLTILLVPAAAAIAVAILSVLTKELSKAKLSSFKVNIAGIKANFVPRDNDDSKNT